MRKKHKISEKSRQRLAEMRRLYEDEGLTLQQVGDRLGVSRQAIHDRLRRAGVKMRSLTIMLERDLLYQLYVIEGLTIPEVGAKLGVSKGVVGAQLKRHGIDRRLAGLSRHPGFERDLIYTLYIIEGLRIAQVAAKLGVGSKIIARELRRHDITFRHQGRPPAYRFDRDELYQLYVVDDLSLADVSAKLGACSAVISAELERNGIKRRPRVGRPKIRILPHT